jgi:flagella basal body P-ring formation protein FlgA
MPQNKNSKRVKSSFVVNVLKQNGYKNIQKQTNYIIFKRKSHIDISDIKNKLLAYYKSNYKHIDIKDIEIYPRGFIKQLPKSYTIHIRNRNYLSHKGILSIKTPKNKQLFFDYYIRANIIVYKTKYKIKKSTQLTPFNTYKKVISLDKLRAKPLQHLTKETLQTKYQLKQDKILTIQNTQKLDVIKRGANISVILHDGGIDISFVARALQNAKVGDTIRVETTNNKKLKVKAIGKNKAEMP